MASRGSSTASAGDPGGRPRRRRPPPLRGARRSPESSSPPGGTLRRGARAARRPSPGARRRAPRRPVRAARASPTAPSTEEATGPRRGRPRRRRRAALPSAPGAWPPRARRRPGRRRRAARLERCEDHPRDPRVALLEESGRPGRARTPGRRPRTRRALQDVARLAPRRTSGRQMRPWLRRCRPSRARSPRALRGRTDRRVLQLDRGDDTGPPAPRPRWWSRDGPRGRPRGSPGRRASSRNASSAVAVTMSNQDAPAPSLPSRFAASAASRAQDAARANTPSVIGAPPIRIRSLIRSTWASRRRRPKRLEAQRRGDHARHRTTSPSNPSRARRRAARSRLAEALDEIGHRREVHAPARAAVRRSQSIRASRRASSSSSILLWLIGGLLRSSGAVETATTRRITKTKATVECWLRPIASWTPSRRPRIPTVIKVYDRFEQAAPHYLLLARSGHRGALEDLQDARRVRTRSWRARSANACSTRWADPKAADLDLDMPGRWTLGDEEIIEWTFGFRPGGRPTTSTSTTRRRTFDRPPLGGFEVEYSSMGLELDRLAQCGCTRACSPPNGPRSGSTEEVDL